MLYTTLLALLMTIHGITSVAPPAIYPNDDKFWKTISIQVVTDRQEFYLSEGKEVNNLLFMNSDQLELRSQLYSTESAESDTWALRKTLAHYYNMKGNQPSIMIYNLTWSESFTFELGLHGERPYWKVTIPRQKLVGTNFHSTILNQWKVLVELTRGTGAAECHGVLVDLTSELLNRWKLGSITKGKAVIDSPITNLVSIPHPCYHDQVILFGFGKKILTGVYLYRYAEGYFDTWFDIKPHICRNLKNCEDTVILDVAMTNWRMLIATTKGVLVSNALNKTLDGPCRVHNTEYDNLLNFTLVNPCQNSSSSGCFKENESTNVHFTYSNLCYTSQGNSFDDTVVVVIPTTQRHTIVAYATIPYLEWDVLVDNNDKNTLLPFDLKDFLPGIETAVYNPHRIVFWVFYHKGNESHYISLRPNNCGESQSRQSWRDTTICKSSPTCKYSIQDRLERNVTVLYAYNFNLRKVVRHRSTNDLYILGDRLYVSWSFMEQPKESHQMSKEGDFLRDCAFGDADQMFTCISEMGNVVLGSAARKRYMEASLKDNGIETQGLYTVVRTENDMSFLVGFCNETNSNSSSMCYTMIPHNIVDNTEYVIRNPLLVQFVHYMHVILHEFDIGTELGSQIPRNPGHDFTPNDVGLAVRQRNGGQCVIKKVLEDHYQYEEGFTHIIWCHVITPFIVDETSDLPKENGLKLTTVEGKLYAAEIQLTGTGVFSDTDLGKTLYVKGGMSFLITKVEGVKAEALTAAPLLKDILFPMEVNMNMWEFYNLGAYVKNGNSEYFTPEEFAWYKSEADCHFNLYPIGWMKRKFFYADIQDMFEGSMLAMTMDKRPIKWATSMIEVSNSNPKVLDVRCKLHRTNGKDILSVRLTSNSHRTAMSSVVFRLPFSSLRCKTRSTTIIVHTDSNPRRNIAFNYTVPRNFTKEEYLEAGEALPVKNRVAPVFQLLPVNYRPPSHLGIGLHMSNHVYNADPTVYVHKTSYLPKEVGVFKLCHGKKTREECGCEEWMKLSESVQYSDCREKAVIMELPVNAKVVTFLEDDWRDSILMTGPYYVMVEEVNSRQDIEFYSMKSRQALNNFSALFTRSKFDNVWDPDDLYMVLKGSGMYHVKISMSDLASRSNVSGSFAIFIKEPPMPYPAVPMAISIGFVPMFIVAIIFGMAYRTSSVKVPKREKKIYTRRRKRKFFFFF